MARLKGSQDTECAGLGTLRGRELRLAREPPSSQLVRLEGGNVTVLQKVELASLLNVRDLAPIPHDRLGAEAPVVAPVKRVLQLADVEHRGPHIQEVVHVDEDQGAERASPGDVIKNMASRLCVLNPAPAMTSRM